MARARERERARNSASVGAAGAYLPYLPPETIGIATSTAPPPAGELVWLWALGWMTTGRRRGPFLLQIQIFETQPKTETGRTRPEEDPLGTAQKTWYSLSAAQKN